jgi:hypothetical protein
VAGLAGEFLAQQTLGAGSAFAAVGGYAEAFAQVAHGRRAQMHGLADFLVGYGIANADIHGLFRVLVLAMRIILIYIRSRVKSHFPRHEETGET